MANKTEKFSKKLRVELTDKEKADLGREMADLQEEVTSIDDVLAQAKAEHKSAMTAIEARATEIGGKLRAGSEYRQVECERYLDYDNAQVVETRLDTEEIVTTRGMTESELQIEMDLIDGSEGDLDGPEEAEDASDPGLTVLETGEEGDEAPRDATEESGEGDGWPEDIQALARHLADTQRCSTNGIRRGCDWGYQKAVKVMEEAEELGIIGPPKGSAPREILMDLSEWATPAEEAEPEESETTED